MITEIGSFDLSYIQEKHNMIS